MPLKFTLGPTLCLKNVIGSVSNCRGSRVVGTMSRVQGNLKNM